MKQSPTTSAPEVRTLKAHDNLVLQVIKRQAGTLAKAVLEGVMNSIDAGAQNISVLVSHNTVTVTDDGKGFESAESIQNVFEVFGMPHELDEEGISTDAKFGTFRIGRGQLFAFGRNVWTTNTFKMCTDIDTKGLQYELYTDQPKVAGCVVTVLLYEGLSVREVQSTVDEITKLCRYVPQNLVVNGTCVARDPATMKWDIDHPLAYIDKKVAVEKWRPSVGLDVYQQGVFVETIPASEFGLEGTIVIKEAVQINFARNQVMRRCGRWKKIAALLKVTGTEDAKQKTKVSPAEARNFVTRFGHGEIQYSEFKSVKCLPDTNGRLWSCEQLTKMASSNGTGTAIHRSAAGDLQVGFGSAGCRSADRVMQQKLALVFDKAILSYMGMTDQQAVAALNHQRSYALAVLVDYKALLDGDDAYTLYSRQQLTPREADFVRAAEHLMWVIVRRTQKTADHRRLCIGSSRDADGWTDGSTYVAVNRSFLEGLDLGLERDWHKVAALLGHEMCHNEPDSGTHNHTPEFYEDFHELAKETLPESARFCYQSFRKILNNRVKKLPKALLNQLHAEAEAYVQAQLAYTPEAEEASKPKTKKLNAIS